MGEVHCLYKWDEKKAKQYESWVKAHDQRFVLFLEDNPQAVILQTPHPRIRCISFPDSPREILEKLAWEFLYLPFSFETPEHPLLQKMASVHSEIGFRAFDYADQGLQLLQNFKNNLSSPASFAKDLYGKFKNTPAIICGGGPSLASVHSQLKRLQDSAVIIGCGAGVEALLKMGIKPHFAAHVDPAPFHRFSSAEIPIFYQLRTAAAVVKKYKGRHFLVSGTGNFPLESWVQKKWDLEPVFDGGWTVGTFGAALAVHLGCNPIILAGVDLATSKGQLYAPGVKTTSTADQFLPMKNREGEPVLSRADWVLAAEWLTQFATIHADRKWGTISSKGLEIPSIPLIRLEDMPASSGISNVVQQAVLQTMTQEGKGIWKEIESSFAHALEICTKILQEMEKTFPQNPTESGACALLEHDLSQEVAFQHVLDPLWTYWRHVISRHNTSGEWGLYLNRILFFQSICEKVHAL
ncbi:MAG TPA: 6-hydroxymethylpterin diphosphokinase MptE-like protein [Rhabdochlamydiaceae bacterium]|nr:6-hydroxymethylpterin diphosphokinase MptE-like protein [Rhabdochlamydiaceae bacterium]